MASCTVDHVRKACGNGFENIGPTRFENMIYRATRAGNATRHDMPSLANLRHYWVFVRPLDALDAHDIATWEA